MNLNRKKFIQLVIALLSVCLILKYWSFVVKSVFIVIDALNPLIIGVAIAYVVNIVMNFYEEKLLQRVRKKRVLSIIMAYGSIILVLVLVLVIIVPELKSCIEILIKSIPSSIDVIQEYMDKLNVVINDVDLDSINWEESINKVISWGTKGFGTTVETVIGYVSSIVSIAMNFIMGFIFSIYILIDKERLKNQINRLLDTYLNEKINKRIVYVAKVLDRSFHNFIVGQTLEAVILGVLCIVGMMIFGFPYAVMIGVFIGCTALIPIAGAYIGGAVGAIMIFTESPFKSVLFVIFLVVLQQLESQLIYPKVVGSSIGLPGIWVFAAVIIGGALFGIMGILFGIPLFSAMYQLIVADVRRKNPCEEQLESESEDMEENE